MFPLRSNQRHIRDSVLIPFFAVFLFFVWSNFAHAAGPNPFDIGAIIMGAVANLIYTVSAGVGGVFVAIAGILLDLSVQFTVLGFGGYVGGSSLLGQGIINMWEVLRDLLNMFFIFGIIFIGIKTIWDAENASTRRALGMLIVAALMVNFSLYITEVIIDFSNIAAVQVLNQITSGGSEAVSTDISSLASSATNIIGLGKTTITGRFLDTIGLTTLFSSLPQNDPNPGLVIVYSILLFFFCIFAAVIFAMGAGLLIARAISLIIYMILSPAMFLGLILPSMKKHQDRWWDGFLKQAFFAPAFLFMLYLSLFILEKVRNVIGFNGQSAQLTEVINGAQTDGAFFTMLFFFFMAMGFLYASIKIAQMMSIAGSSSSLKMLDSSGKSIRGAIAGGLYRGTVGKAAGGVGKFMDNADRRLANSEKDDTNHNWVVRKGRQATRAMLREGVFSPEARAKVAAVKDYKAGGDYSISEMEKRNKERAEKVAASNSKSDLKDAIKNGLAAPAGSAGDAARIKMEEVLAESKAGDLAKLASSKEDLEMLLKIVGNLPEKKFEGLMEDKGLAPDALEKLGRERKEAVKRVITAAGGTLQKGISGASAEQLNALDFKELSDNALYVQSSQLDKLESKWGDEKMRIFKDKRKADILSTFATNPTEVLNSRKNEKEIAKLPTDLFTNANTALMLDELVAQSRLNGSLMQSIAADSGMNGTQKKDFGAAVRARFTNPATGATNVPKDLEGFFRSSAGAAFL